MMTGSIIANAVLLVALALGYIVCYLANREEKSLRTGGYMVGVFIIIFSGILLVNNLLLSTRECMLMGKLGMMMPQHRMMMKGPMGPAQAIPQPEVRK
jgi:hypothetical protein